MMRWRYHDVRFVVSNRDPVIWIAQWIGFAAGAVPRRWRCLNVNRGRLRSDVGLLWWLDGSG